MKKYSECDEISQSDLAKRMRVSPILNAIDGKSMLALNLVKKLQKRLPTQRHLWKFIKRYAEKQGLIRLLNLKIESCMKKPLSYGGVKY